jgi:2-oxoglutarate ferredoxin oxidoreductase subunit alpha
MKAVTLAIYGAGGSGAISAGEILLRAAARHGLFGLLRKTFSPQIRGGESAVVLRLGTAPVRAFEGTIDVLVVLDWKGFERFADDLPVSDRTLVLQAPGAGAAPPAAANARAVETPDFGAEDELLPNVAFLAWLGCALGFRAEAVDTVVHQRLGRLVEARGAAVRQSLAAGQGLPPLPALGERLGDLAVAAEPGERWMASGNQMAALGALDAGVRVVAAYPITPASDLLEFLARHLPGRGGHLIQAEDELAAVHMVLGAGFGGVPAFTATSGPGLALMAEAMGLAVASETPAVIVDVMRGGPSTGIPTRSEQGDLDIALHGLHGDAPHVVLACADIPDCHRTVAWAVALAMHLQTLVVVLSDQFLGHSIQVFDVPREPLPPVALVGARDQPRDAYRRYADTPDGISPMAVPGEPGHAFTADGLEHREDAIPSSSAADHRAQLAKRRRKLEGHDFGDRWADLAGTPDGRTLVVCCGSVSSAALEARERLGDRDGEGSIAVLTLRLLAPLRVEALDALFRRAARILVVEQNHEGQLRRHLNGALPGHRLEGLAVPGPTLITPGHVVAAVRCQEVEACP